MFRSSRQIAQDEKLIVSEKAVGEEELRAKMTKLTNRPNVVEAEVSGIVDFGIFVKFGDRPGRLGPYLRTVLESHRAPERSVQSRSETPSPDHFR